MNYARAYSLAILVQLGSLSDLAPANAQNSQYALDRLFLEESDTTPLYDVLSFSSETAVANYYGATSQEATLATEFFAGYTGSSANMLFTRYPILPARAHLYGSNISGLTLPQLQAISGSLSLTSEGYNYTASINLSTVQNFSAAATAIQAALNKKLPVAAVTTGSSIAAVSAPFTGSIDGDVLKVSTLSSGSIQIGSYITGPGVPAGTQITSQIKGTPNGVGTYGLFVVEPSTSTKALADTYGVLTIGSVSSGTVKVGQQVAGVTPAGSPGPTAIEANLHGSGAGGTWVVNNAETVAPQSLTMEGAPLNVIYNAVTGATANSGAFWIQQNGNFNYASSSLTYAGGTAADSLGLTQAAGAFLSSPGQIVTSASDWMDNFTQNFSDQFSSFQAQNPGGLVPGEKTALEAWAQSTAGQYEFLKWTRNTPPIVNSIVPNAERLFAGSGVPEPSTWAMMVIGIAGLGFVRFRRARTGHATRAACWPRLMRRPSPGHATRQSDWSPEITRSGPRP
jgi:hypothetical protein